MNSSMSSINSSRLMANDLNKIAPTIMTNNTQQTLTTLFEQDSTTSLLLDEHLDRIQLVADIGYLLSLLTLVFALLILTCIKRLRSPKNSLHLHLFISFIIRSSFSLIKTFLVDRQLLFSIDLNGLLCRCVTVVWHYSLLANYNWILMEGAYLYSLIFFTSTSPYGPSVYNYMIFGWLAPIIPIIAWMIPKLNDETCWIIGDNHFWILRFPITLTILVNFFIYIRIVLVLYSKIFSGTMTLQTSKRETENNYKKLIRSTLVLIPLFGIHYTGLLIFHEYAVKMKNDLAHVIWLYLETAMSSFQGCIVACLYCFLNDEVHQEIKRVWRRVK